MSNELIERESDGVVSTQRLASADGVVSRESQRIQAMIFMAKKDPRDENASLQSIMNACKRRLFAEKAIYSYTKGGTEVEGPSIRMAEELARSWGNIEFGVAELSNKPGESEMLAYCWDLEKNIRSAVSFTVKHIRAARGSTYAVTDPREIYELTANFAARRMRKCIMAVIPADVQELAIEACNKTLESGGGEPLIDRVRKMLLKFSEYGVTQEQIEQRAGRAISGFNEKTLVEFAKIFNSLKDGMSSVENWFEIAAPESSKGKSKAEQVRERASKAKGPQLPAQLRDYGKGIDAAKTKEEAKALFGLMFESNPDSEPNDDYFTAKAYLESALERLT